MLRFTLLLTVLLGVMQAVEAGPHRFGSIARGLTDAEVVQVTELATAAGQLPWLVIGFPSMMSGVVRMSLYLEPDVAYAAVRRGRILTLETDAPPTIRDRSPWKVTATRPYADIVAPGHRPGEVTDERDISWPFLVQGEVDDETLSSVVAFIRSKPPIPSLPDAAVHRNVSGAPIAALAREGDGFIVALRTSEATGERVTVSRATGHWVITHFESWIV